MRKPKLVAIAIVVAGIIFFHASKQVAIRPVFAGNEPLASITLDTTKPANENTAPASGWSFRNHVIPVLTRLGCNSGACHGAAAGKAGFKLTLRGYDPELDYNVLSRQSLGRRINKIEPAKSLILLKPTMAIGHGGGKRLDVGSLEYKVISEWIASGMAAPAESDARIVRLEVTPKASTLAAGSDQQLRVLAKYNDGRAEDVTRWVKYSSADPGIASVDDDGKVKMQGARRDRDQHLVSEPGLVRPRRQSLPERDQARSLCPLASAKLH